MFKEFKDGYEDPENDHSTAQNLDTTATAHELVSKQLSNDLQIDDQLHINRQTICHILYNDLGKIKMCVLFVPHR
jgi:hypothetical protein